MRRRALLSALGAGGALLVGWGLLPPRSRIGTSGRLPADRTQIALNGWIRIDADGRVGLVMARSEMGQGTHTALAMLVAEELDVPLDRVQLEPVGPDSLYGNVSAAVEAVLHFGPDATEPGAESRALRATRWVLSKAARELGIVTTGGSSSIADLFPVLPLAAATARAQLLGAASLRWKLPVAELQVSRGVVSHPSGVQAHYGELARFAAATPPGTVRPRPRAQWWLVGQAVPRIDIPAKVDGRARFGIDVRLPGLLFAAVRHAPQLGGSPGAVDVDAVLRRPGVLRVVRLPPLAGAAPALAVVARTSWHALQAAQELPVVWQAPPNPPADSDQILRELQRDAEDAADARAGFAFRDDGDVDAWLGASGPWIEAAYRAPYLAHQTMEPQNCTARVADGRVELWAPTQSPTYARAAAAAVAGVPEHAVQLNVTYLGGGFGRRLEVDVVAQAVRVALETGGAPVQLLWSREEDTRHDFFRPAAVAVQRARLGDDGLPLAWALGSAGDAVMPRYLERVMPQLAPPQDLPDKTAAEGLFDLPYRVPNLRVVHRATRHRVPVGSWRAVGHSHNAFFAESFIDEMALAAQHDPVAYRLALLDGRPRHAAVLRHVAERAGWGRPLPAGRGRGVALHASYGSIAAMVVEASLGEDSRPRVRRVVVAADCGTVVHPGIVAQQLESGVMFGLAAALFGRIDITRATVSQRNFADLPLLTLADTPQIETHLMPNDRPPSGVGEIAVPPVAPALAGALFMLTRRRWRDLPFTAV